MKILDNFLECIKSANIIIDLDLEYTITKLEEGGIESARQDAANNYNKAKNIYDNCIMSCVDEPSYLLNIEGKTYDLRNFKIFNFNNFIDRKKGSLPEDVYLNLLDTTLKYNDNYEKYINYISDVTKAKKRLNNWENIVNILSDDGPLLKPITVNKYEVNEVPSGSLVLSIKQPFINLIIHGFKTIELRNFCPPKNLTIPFDIYLHATKPDRNPMSIVKQMQSYYVPGLVGTEFTKYKPDMNEFIYGCIIGKTTIIDVIKFKDEKHYLQFTKEHLCPYPYFKFVKYGYVLSNIELVKPVYTKGKLLFWKYFN